jgi:nucleoside-diphosphate-sugar epimerase
MYLNHLVAGETIPELNFGPTEPSLKVRKVVDIVKKVWHDISINYDLTKIPNGKESVNLDLDSSLAIKKINWNPTWTQEKAVEQTLNWWSEIIRGEVPVEVTREEIRQFLSL